MSPREAFLAVLFNGPILRSDAVVVLAGEDAEARLRMATGIMLQGGAPILVLTGKLDDPPSKLGAERLRGMALGLGVLPDHIRVDAEAVNTREQAQDVVGMARAAGWKRLLLVASPYHTPRAFLTFVQALADVGADHEIHILPAPATQTHWFDCPPGLAMERVELTATEFAKIGAYHEVGDVASYQDGLRYLRYWEEVLEGKVAA